jgi:hypothetical protein
MTINYTWAVTGMKTIGINDGAGNYVVQTYWTKTGTDENDNTGTFNGATPFDSNPQQQNFIPFEQLTEEIVIGWIKQVVVGDYAQHVNAQIMKQIAEKTTPVTNTPMPWAPAPQSPTEG